MSGLLIGAIGSIIKAVTARGLRQATAGSYSGGSGFTPTVTGWHRIRLQGGGGGGTSGGTKRGGCAGMYTECVLYLTSGTAYAYTVGAAGAVGGAGGNTSFTGPHNTPIAYGGSADTGVNGRFDGVTTDGAAANHRGQTIDGARGGIVGGLGGYCGVFKGGTDGIGLGGGGGASLFAAGGNGGSTGVAGTLGSGGGGGTTGSVGGAGLVEIEYIGTN